MAALKTPRVTPPKPFTIFACSDGVAVRIGTQKPFFAAGEVFLSAPAVLTRSSDGAIVVSGEGVVRREGRTIRICA